MEKQRVFKRIGIVFTGYIVTLVVLLIIGRTAGGMTIEKEFNGSQAKMTEEQRTLYSQETIFNEKVYKLEKIKEESEMVTPEPYRHIVEKLVMTKDELQPDNKITLKINDESKDLFLTDVRYEEAPVNNRVTIVRDTQEYNKEYTQPAAPETKEIEYLDEFTGQKIPTTVKLEKIEKYGDDLWADDFSKEFFVNGYGADYYEIGNIKIYPTEDGLDVEGKEETLLKHLGLNPAQHRIYNATWVGGAVDSSRKVKITGQRLVGNYRAFYVAENVKLPDAIGYKAFIEYQDRPSITDATYRIKAVGFYRKDLGIGKYILVTSLVLVVVLIFIGIKYYMLVKKEA